MTFKPKTYIDEKGRVCSRCNEFKLWNEFGKHSTGVNGRNPSCKICNNKLSKEWAKENPEKRRNTTKKYRQSKKTDPVHVLTKRYRAMIDRCYNPDNFKYPIYGGRGITVCRDWRGEKGKENFIKWALASGFKPELQIDRIDNNKGYSPGNCRFTTCKKNSSNRRDNIYLFQGDKKFTLAEFAERVNVPYHIVYSGYQRELAEENHKGG